MCIANTTTTTTASGNHSSTNTNNKENINTTTNNMYHQQQQQYSVQLVHAETKQPFSENHGPDGKVHSSMDVGESSLSWIEVEVAGTANNKHRFRFSPNGKILGYQNTLTPRNRSRSNSTSSTNSNSSSNSSSTSRPVRSDLWAYRYADRTDGGLMCFRRPELDDHATCTSTKSTDTPENVLMGDISLKFLETMHQGSFSPRVFLWRRPRVPHP